MADTFGARAAAKTKRLLGEGIGAVGQRFGSVLGAVANNPVARVAGDFANEYWGGMGMPSTGGVAPMPSATSAPVVARRPTARPDMSMANELYAQDTQARPAAGPGALPPVAPMTAADIRGTAIPPSGTGAFVNNRTGAVTNLDTRSAAAPSGPMVDASTYDMMRGFRPRAASAPVEQYDTPRTAAGVFFQGGARMKTRANTEAAEMKREEIGSDLAKARAGLGVTLRGQDLAAQTAAQRLGVDAALKRPGAEKDAATADRESLQAEMAREYLKSNPGDYAGAAGIASGRPLPTDKFGILPSMTGNDVITYDKGGKTPPRIQTPIRTVSEADIQTTMKNNKMTREQVIARLKAEGKM